MAEELAPLTRTITIDATAYRNALIELADLHDALGNRASAGADASDRASQRTGQSARKSAEDVRQAARAMGAAADDAARKGEASAQRREVAEREAAQKAGQSWRDFVAQRLGDYQRMEGGHGAAMRRIAAEWGTYKAAGLAATSATERGLRGVGEEADRTRRKLEGAAGQFDRLGSVAGRGAKFGGVAQDAVQVGQALRSGDLPGAAVGLGQLQQSASAAGLTTGRAAMLGAGAAGIAAVGAAAVSATAKAARFEEQMVAIKRTAGLSDDELAKLADRLLETSGRLGVSTDALTTIAEGAGSLDIKGADKIAAFTEVVAKFSSATGMSAGASTEALGRISKSFREPIENAERLGSVLDRLADDTGATTEQIVFSLQRVGAAGKGVGLTASQVAAFVAVMNEAGVDASDAGTTMRNALTIVQAEAGKVARVMGTTKAAWLEAFGADPQKAITDLLGKLKELEPTARTVAIEDLFGRENLVGVTTLVSNLDRVTVALEAQQSAYSEGTRLQQSFEESTRTMGAQWRILSETMSAWLTGAGAGASDALEGLLRVINGVTGATTEAERAHAEYSARLADQAALDRLIERHDELTKKTALTATEQSELAAVVKALGEQVPGAITRWDDLGGALDVHMGKVRETAQAYRDLATAMLEKAQQAEFDDIRSGVEGREQGKRLDSGTGSLWDHASNPERSPWRRWPERVGDLFAGRTVAETSTRDSQRLIESSAEQITRGLQALAKLPAFLSGNQFMRELPGASLSDYGRYVSMRGAATSGPVAASDEEPEGTDTYTPTERKPRGPSAETLAERARRAAERASDADFEAEQYARLRGTGTQYAATQAAVAAALEKATQAQRDYAAALDAPHDVTTSGVRAAPDGAATEVLRQQAELRTQAYEASVRSAATYAQALDTVARAEAAVHEAQQARSRAAAGSAEHADLDAIVTAREAEVAAAKQSLTLAEQTERIDRRRASALERMAGAPALADLVKEYGGLDKLGGDGLDLDMATTGAALFERAQNVRRTFERAQSKWARAHDSGNAEYEQEALDGYRDAAAQANVEIMAMIETFRSLDVPPKLAEWLSGLLTALADDVPDDLRGTRSIKEGTQETLRAARAEADLAQQEQAVRLLERGAASLDETAQLADAWGQVGEALGVLPARAAAAAGAFAGVFRALAGVRQMQADIARIELQRKTLMEASKAAEAAKNGPEAARLAAEAGALSAPSGVAAMMPYVGVALAGISVVSSLVAWGRQSSEEYKQLRRSLAEAAESIARSVSDARRQARFGADVSRKEADEVEKAAAAIRGGGLTQQQREAAYRTIYNSPVDGADRLQGQYDAAFGVLKKGGGLSTDEIRKILDDVFFGDGQVNGFDWKAHLERMMGGPMGDFGAWLSEWVSSLGQYTDSVAAALERLDFVSRYLGGDANEALTAFVEALETTGGLPEDLRSLLTKAKALDLTTEAGRQQLLTLLGPLLKSFYDGTLSLPAESDLTSNDLMAILDALLGLAGGTDGGSGGGYSRQTQIAGTITETQTNELLYWQAEQTRLLRSIEALTRQRFIANVEAMPPLVASDPRLYAAPLYGAAPAGQTGNGAAGLSLVVNVRAEHRIEDILEHIAKELDRTTLFEPRLRM